MNGLSREFWKDLQKRYKELDDGLEAWKNERDALKEVIPLIIKELSQHGYKLIEPLRIGGVGIPLKLRYENLETFRVVKFPRQIKDKEELFASIVRSEIERLMEAVHPNIITIYYQSAIRRTKHVDLPFYVMEFLQNAMDAEDFFQKPVNLSRDNLIKVVKQLTFGLCHLHSLDIVHLDLKPSNILVSGNTTTVVADLGSARSLLKGSKITKIFYTPEYSHPEMILNIKNGRGTEQNRHRGDIERRKLNKNFDLYSLGKTIFRFLKFYENCSKENPDPYIQNFFRLMASRLLQGYNDDNECAMHLSKSAFNQLSYENVEQVYTDLMKLTGEYSLRQRIPEIDIFNPKKIQVSSQSVTQWTERLHITVHHPLIQRLAGVSQLGFINLVYPTATHTRFEHVLGTFSNVCRYCDALYNDAINPFFKQVMYDPDIKAVLLAALFHDIGQYPLAHDLEEAHEEVFSHEEYAYRILTAPISKQLLKTIESIWGVSVSKILAILLAKPRDLNHSVKDRILHTLINGPIDADKLDYLIRDSNNLNVTFGKGIDFGRLLQCLTVVFRSEIDGTYAALGIHEKGKPVAETIAFARYSLFGAVYWHHTVRSAKAMLHRVVWEALSQKDGDQFRLFKNEFFNFVSEGDRYQPFKITEGVDTAKSTQILPSDYEILCWLRERTTPRGKQLIALLSERHLFKRLLVISHQKREHLWEELRKVYKKFDDDYARKIDLQQRIQDKIIETAICNKTASSSVVPGQIALNYESPKESKDILILLDIPTERSENGNPLEYLPEKSPFAESPRQENPVRLEDSVVWRNLHDLFMESIGKYRVFCHPDIVSFIINTVREDDIESIITRVVRNLY